MISWLQHRWTGLYLLILALGALMLFLYGFIPLKYSSGKLSQMSDLPNFIDGVSIDRHEAYNSGENTVILMVIDGLRYDFVTDEQMPFTKHLVKNKSACIYVSVAQPPTVTLPRIKAMATGSVSTFADVVLNLGAPAVRGDSLLRVAATRGRRCVLYGDDTWLKLFPGLWAEYNVSSNFYLADFTEMDKSVTRQLPNILAPNEKMKPKFDFLVLHYSGIDHIGHVEGARSPKMKLKLLEMDNVIKSIYIAMQKWESNGVLMVSSDHGMRDSGGHGGASPAEIFVPLVLTRNGPFLCPHPGGVVPTVSQTDVAPSVAWLLNAPPPADNVGRVLPALLPQEPRQHLYVLHTLAHQLIKYHVLPTDAEFYKQFQRAEKQFAQYLISGQQTAAKISKEYYDECLEAMSKFIEQTCVYFDMYSLCVAILLLYCIYTSIICVTLYSLQPDSVRISVAKQHKHQSKGRTFVMLLISIAVCAITMTLACLITETKSQLCSSNAIWLLIFSLIACAFTMTFIIIKTGIEKTIDTTILKKLNNTDYLLIFGTLIHPWFFIGTSYIEEEQMMWYFFWNTIMFVILVRIVVVVLMYYAKVPTESNEVQKKPTINMNLTILPKWILIIALHRYLRTLNQTSNRGTLLQNTEEWLNAPENKLYLNIQLIASTLFTCGICLRNLKHTNNCIYIHTVLTILSTLCIFSYRINTKSFVIEAPPCVYGWDPVQIVDVFWATLILQFVVEFVSYVWNYWRYRETGKQKSKEELWHLDEFKLNMVRSISHLLFNFLMLVISLLMRSHNVIMVPSIYLTCWLNSKCIEILDVMMKKRTEIVDVLNRTLIHLWIGYAFYFYQGNSNSLASVDLGSGYVGLREYSLGRVGARVALHAYAAPTLASVALYCALAARAPSWTVYLQSVWRASNIYALHRVYTVAVYCVVAAAFRHHLFVWSVFSPKLLYDLAATVFTVQALGTMATIVLLTHVASWVARTLVYRTR